MNMLGIHKETEQEEFAARARMLKDMNNLRLPVQAGNAHHKSSRLG